MPATYFYHLKTNTMKKTLTLAALLTFTLIIGTGCQSVTNGIANRTSCSDRLLKTCTGTTSKAAEEDEPANATGSADVLHELPFSTLIQ